VPLPYDTRGGPDSRGFRRPYSRQPDKNRDPARGAAVFTMLFRAVGTARNVLAGDGAQGIDFRPVGPGSRAWGSSFLSRNRLPLYGGAAKPP